MQFTKLPFFSGHSRNLLLVFASIIILGYGDPSGPITIFSFVSRQLIYLEIRPAPLLNQEEGQVF
jgi:hypothetical protein